MTWSLVWAMRMLFLTTSSVWFPEGFYTRTCTENTLCRKPCWGLPARARVFDRHYCLSSASHLRPDSPVYLGQNRCFRHFLIVAYAFYLLLKCIFRTVTSVALGGHRHLTVCCLVLPCLWVNVNHTFTLEARLMSEVGATVAWLLWPLSESQCATVTPVDGGTRRLINRVINRARGTCLTTGFTNSALCPVMVLNEERRTVKPLKEDF